MLFACGASRTRSTGHDFVPTTFTVMAKNIGILAILSENATLLSENCSNCKCFGIHMIIVFVCTETTQKNNREEESNFKGVKS